MKWLLLIVIAAALFFGGAAMIASELGGEVVVLHTEDDVGLGYQTSLWVIDDRGQIWLRAGQPGADWLERLKARPRVQLERGGVTVDYNARVLETQRDRINRLMAEKYGWADQLIGMRRDDSGTMPIRLDPIRR